MTILWPPFVGWMFFCSLLFRILSRTRVFDGKSNTFFWGGTSVGPEHYFTIVLGEPMKVNEVKVITGDSKDYITMADLLISEDGENFVKVGKFDDLGQASATPDAAKTIKAVKIQITGQHTCWPIIKEIILK